MSTRLGERPLPAIPQPAGEAPGTKHDAQRRDPRTERPTRLAPNPLAMHPTAAPSKTLPEAVIDLLATVASASSTITNFIRSVRAAHTDLAALTRELADLQLVLELLRDDSEVPPPLQPRIIALLDSCGDVLARIDRVLAGCWVESLGKARWGMRERDAATSLKFGMQVHREALALLLEVANLASTINEQAGTASSDDAEDMRQQAGRLLDDVGRLRDTVPQVKSDSEASAAALQSYLDELTSYAQTVCHVVLGGPRQDDPKEAITVMLENGGPSTAMQKVPNGAPSCGHAHTVSCDSTQAPSTHHKRDESSDKIVVEPTMNSPTINSSKSRDESLSIAEEQPLEAIGPWYPPENQAMPFYRHDSLQSVGSGRGPASITTASQHSHSNSRSEHLLPPINAGDSELGLPWSAPKLISTGSWNTNSNSPPAPPAGVSPPRSKRTSSQQSTTGSLFDGVTSARTSITTEYLSSFPVPPPRKPSFQPSFEAPHSVQGSCASSIRPTTTSRRSSETTLDHLPLPPTRAEVFGQPSRTNSLGISVSARPPSPLCSELQAPVQPSTMELIPEKRLFAKEKGPGCFYIEVSPAGSTMAVKHANNTVSVWSLVTNTLQSVVKVPAKTQVEARSRKYFIRSHAIVSESMAMLAMTTSFGNTVELWSWSRRKKKQTISDAYRWAASREDAYSCPHPSLAVYRGDESPVIDLFRFSRDPAFKKPFSESGPAIDLRLAGLPFPMRLPELAFCATAPLLVAAAGPRPRDPPEAQKVSLAAWALDGDSARQGSTPYRWVIPEHKELHKALPTSLAAYGDLAVSTWVPASSVSSMLAQLNKTPIVTAQYRYILVWDMGTNTTKVHPIPNAQCVVSPDCRFVAYCDAAGGRMGVVETSGGKEVWSWPCDRLKGSLHYRQLDDLKRVTEFAFSADGMSLLVGDCDGSVGVYNIRLG